MNTTNERTGLDVHSDTTFVARVQHSSGRPVVTELKSIAAGAPTIAEPFERVSIAVTNACVVTKHVNVSELVTVEPKLAAEHELSLRLLDPPEDYLYELLPTESQFRWLGMALKKECAEELLDRIVTLGMGNREQIDFSARAVALGKGLNTLAIGSGGDFIAAVELDHAGATLCFLRNGRIVDVGYCPLQTANGSGEDSSMREIRTVLAFHQSRLFGLGITTPLTEIVLCGQLATEARRKSLQRYFQGTISIPRLNAGYFADPSILSDPAAHRYLVALGLALE